MTRPALIFILFGLLGSPTARAQLPATTQMEMCISGKGMAPGVLNKARRQFMAYLNSLGVEFVTPPRTGDCCTSSGCLGEEAVKLGAQGILNIEILRVGPMVRATFYLFDAVTKKQILLAKGTASARKFPTAGSFTSELSRCIGVLNKHARSHQLVAITRPKETTAVKTRPSVKPLPPKPRVAPALHRPVEPPPAHQAAPDGRSNTAWYWLGGSLLAGGVSLAAVGIYFLAVPLQQAQDRVTESRAEWLAADEQEAIDDSRAELLENDRQAQKYDLLGWLGIGLGAALLAGGAVALLLGPEHPPARSNDLSLRPYLQSGGGGLILELPW